MHKGGRCLPVAQVFPWATPRPHTLHAQFVVDEFSYRIGALFDTTRGSWSGDGYDYQPCGYELYLHHMQDEEDPWYYCFDHQPSLAIHMDHLKYILYSCPLRYIPLPQQYRSYCRAHRNLIPGGINKLLHVYKVHTLVFRVHQLY